MPRYPLYIYLCATLALVLTVGGWIVGTAFPGRLTGLLFPLGLTGWALLGWLIRRIDRKRNQRNGCLGETDA